MDLLASVKDIQEDVRECIRRAPHLYNAGALGGLLDRLERIDKDLDNVVTEVTEVTTKETR